MRKINCKQIGSKSILAQIGSLYEWLELRANQLLEVWSMINVRESTNSSQSLCDIKLRSSIIGDGERFDLAI